MATQIMIGCVNRQHKTIAQVELERVPTSSRARSVLRDRVASLRGKLFETGSGGMSNIGASDSCDPSSLRHHTSQVLDGLGKMVGEISLLNRSVQQEATHLSLDLDYPG